MSQTGRCELCQNLGLLVRKSADTICYWGLCVTCALDYLVNLLVTEWWPAIRETPVYPVPGIVPPIAVLHEYELTMHRLWTALPIRCRDVYCQRDHATAWEWYTRILSVTSRMKSSESSACAKMQKTWFQYHGKLERELQHRRMLLDTDYDPLGLPVTVSSRCATCGYLAAFHRTETAGLPLFVTCEPCGHQWCTGCLKVVTEKGDHEHHRFMWAHLKYTPQKEAYPVTFFQQFQLSRVRMLKDFPLYLNTRQWLQLVNGMNVRLLHFTLGVTCASCQGLLLYRSAWTRSTVLVCARCQAETCLHCGGLLCITGAEYREHLMDPERAAMVANQWKPGAVWQVGSLTEAGTWSDERYLPASQDFLLPAQHHERWTEWCNLNDPVPAGRCMPSIELLSCLRWFQRAADVAPVHNFLLLRYLQGRCLRGLWQYLFRDCQLSLAAAQALLLNTQTSLGAHWPWIRHWVTSWQCAEPAFSQPFMGQPLVLSLPLALTPSVTAVWKATDLWSTLPGCISGMETTATQVDHWWQLYRQQQVFAMDQQWPSVSRWIDDAIWEEKEENEKE